MILNPTFVIRCASSRSSNEIKYGSNPPDLDKALRDMTDAPPMLMISTTPLLNSREPMGLPLKISMSVRFPTTPPIFLFDFEKMLYFPKIVSG